MLAIHGVAMQPNPTLMTLGSLPERKQVHTRIGKALLCYCCTATANLSIWHVRLPSVHCRASAVYPAKAGHAESHVWNVADGECSLSKLLKRTLVRSVT
jgi:hypothetical protein